MAKLWKSECTLIKTSQWDGPYVAWFFFGSFCDNGLRLNTHTWYCFKLPGLKVAKAEFTKGSTPFQINTYPCFYKLVRSLSWIWVWNILVVPFEKNNFSHSNLSNIKALTYLFHKPQRWRRCYPHVCKHLWIVCRLLGLFLTANLPTSAHNAQTKPSVS